MDPPTYGDELPPSYMESLVDNNNNTCNSRSTCSRDTSEYQARSSNNDQQYLHIRLQLVEAVQQGNTTLVETVLSSSATSATSLIGFNQFLAFRRACELGHLNLVLLLSSRLPSSSLKEMIKSQNYYAFRYATLNGHLHVMHQLFRWYPKIKMITAGTL